MRYIRQLRSKTGALLRDKLVHYTKSIAVHRARAAVTLSATFVAAFAVHAAATTRSRPALKVSAALHFLGRFAARRFRPSMRNFSCFCVACQSLLNIACSASASIGAQ